MPTRLDVERQRFEFGDEWLVALKYDDTTFYRKRVALLPETKAVDLLGFHPAAGLLLLEAKDFRGYRIKNKPRISQGDVVVEVAQKARDTVAGLIGAERHGGQSFDSALLADGLAQSRSVMVVLWLEDDEHNDPRQAKTQLKALNDTLKMKLGWLNVRTLVLSSKTENFLPDLKVGNLAGVPQPA